MDRQRGKGFDCVGLYDPFSGSFYLSHDNKSKPQSDQHFAFGPTNANFLPLIGDWNGDGVDTIGLYDRQTGVFLLHNKNEATSSADLCFHFGPINEKLVPITGDWNGDGTDSVGLLDPGKGTFYFTDNLVLGEADQFINFEKGSETAVPLIVTYLN